MKEESDHGVHPQNGMSSPRVDTPSCRHDCLFEMDWSLHSVSIRQGWLHVKELFSRIHLVSSTLTAAFLPNVDEGLYSREDEGGSQRLSLSGRTTGEPRDSRFASTPLLFGLGGLKQGDRDSTDPPRFFGRRLRPAPCFLVLSKTRRDPLR